MKGHFSTANGEIVIENKTGGETIALAQRMAQSAVCPLEAVFFRLA